MKGLYKLTHLPAGMTRESLIKLGTEMVWPLKPIKRLDQRTWLVGAHSNPSTWCVQLGKASILITSVQTRKSAASPVVLAGKTPEPKAATSSADPWLHHDPWANAAAKAAPAAPRTTSGPVQAKQEDQDNRLNSLEQRMQALAEGQKKIEDSQHEMQSAITTQLHGIVAAVTTQLETSMQQAISKALKARPSARDKPEKAEPAKKAQRVVSDDDDM